MIPYLHIFLGALVLAVIALVAWSFWMVPRWSRPGIFFAVTVPVPFTSSPEAADMLRSYRLQTMLHVGVSFALIVGGALTQIWFLLLLGMLWLIGGPIAAFLGGHKRATHYAIPAVTIREVTLEARETKSPGGWLAQLCPFAILIAVAIYLQIHWDEIPARFPVHWGIDGRPNGWSVRTPMGVYFPLILAFVILAGIAPLAYGMIHWTRRIPDAQTGSVKHDFARRVSLFLLIVEYFLACVFSLVALLPLTGGIGPGAIVGATILMLPILMILIAWLGKGRMHPETHADAQAVLFPGDATPDKCWKFGLFYFNPNDAALLVEKRFGVGYTLNFAHPSAWICLALVLLVPLLLLFTFAKR